MLSKEYAVKNLVGFMQTYRKGWFGRVKPYKFKEPEEREFYTSKVVGIVGSMYKQIYHPPEHDRRIEIVERGDGAVSAIRLTARMLEKYVGDQVNNAVFCLNSNLRRSVYGGTSMQVVPEYAGKVKDWFVEEICEKTSDGAECLFLENILMTEEDDHFTLRVTKELVPRHEQLKRLVEND